MSGRLRVLDGRELGEALAFLERSPIENLFLTSKLGDSSQQRRHFGRLLAYRDDSDEIRALCLDAGTIFVTGNDSAALPLFVEELGKFRRATSIVGPSFAALGLFVGLSERYGDVWRTCSNVRRKQPLMVLDVPPSFEGDARVERLDESHFQSYLDASVDMYVGEIGSSPFKYGPGYESFVLSRLRNGDAYGIVEDGEVIFKADLGPRHDGQVQLQGVWVRPDLRGQGLSKGALAQMMMLVRREYPMVSLYVNDFNQPAVRSYERIGFRTVGSLSTVHY
ncbi:MAG: GNAT family N-acetyltransferase [Propionibacteriaceae bacterium]|nr:GNAT family N-acetyltransferase [Propionibacteriaceae bacterium]